MMRTQHGQIRCDLGSAARHTRAHRSGVQRSTLCYREEWSGTLQFTQEKMSAYTTRETWLYVPKFTEAGEGVILD